MRAFLKLSVGKKFHTAVEQYSQALEILAWGRSFFANVPDKTRGMIFSSTFIRGVRRLYLNALMAVSRIKNSFYPLSLHLGICSRQV